MSIVETAARGAARTAAGVLAGAVAGCIAGFAGGCGYFLYTVAFYGGSSGEHIVMSLAAPFIGIGAGAFAGAVIGPIVAWAWFARRRSA